MIEAAEIVVLYAMVFCGVIMLCGEIRAIRISKGYFVIAIIFSCCAAFWAFNLDPNPSLDLYRLHQSVEWVRLNSINFIDAVANPADKYVGLTGFNILAYFVTVLGSHNWLQTIGTFTTFSILLCILIDYIRTEKYDSRAILPAIAMIFMGLQLQYVFSGVRNAMAVSIVMLALYRYYYKKKKKLALSIAMVAFAGTLHPASLLLLMGVVAVKSNAKNVARLIALCAMPLIFLIADVVRNVPISTVQYIGNRVMFYYEYAYAGNKTEMISNIVAFIAIFGGYCLAKKLNLITNESAEWKKYIDYYSFMGFLMIGCAVQRDFTLRIGYCMGILDVPVLLRILFRIKGKGVAARYWAGLMNIAVLGVLALCCLEVYYGTFYSMSRWKWG